MNVRDIRHQRFTLGDITLLTTSPTHIWPHHLNKTSAVLICAHIWYQIHRRAGGFSWPRLRMHAAGPKSGGRLSANKRAKWWWRRLCILHGIPQFCAFSVFLQKGDVRPRFFSNQFCVWTQPTPNLSSSWRWQPQCLFWDNAEFP